ncbi:ABC transporter permease subunit [Haliangium sp.]|uniref:ABC transporter permease n=1 Tax=Haliangium sp. TaxID=2663208 RepID=UPI003D1430E6
MTRRPWLRVRSEPSGRARRALTVLAFALPLLTWSAISYVPFLWHPLVLVEDPGDASAPGDYAYLQAGQLVDEEVFEARNGELAAAGKPPAQGTPANPIYLPPPHQVGAALYTAFITPPQRAGDHWLHESLWHSAQIIFWGFFYSALLGVPLGVLCGAFGMISRLFEPFVDFIRYMPAPVFGALAVAILGLADGPKIAIVFIGTFFQMVLVVANTTRHVDDSLLEAGQTLGAGNRQLMLHVVVPSILPNLFRDMRVLIGWAWTYLVVAELIGEKSGISAFIYQQQRYRNFENVYAAILLIGLVGLVTDQLLGRLERVAFPWKYGPSRIHFWLAGLRLRREARQRAAELVPPQREAQRS